MWGLGCLIWEVFNGNLPKTTSLKALGKVSYRQHHSHPEFNCDLKLVNIFLAKQYFEKY